MQVLDQNNPRRLYYKDDGLLANHTHGKVVGCPQILLEDSIIYLVFFLQRNLPVIHVCVHNLQKPSDCFERKLVKPDRKSDNVLVYIYTVLA